MSNRLKLIFYSILIAILFLGCLPEKKIAREYFSSGDKEILLVLHPDYVYKESLKEYEYEGSDTLGEEELDSLLFFSSLYLQYINDTLFMDSLVSNLVTNLKKLGFTVFLEGQVNEFLRLEKKAYIINIAQVLLEEFVYPHEAEIAFFDEVVVFRDIDLNALAISIWIEMSPVNTDDEASRVLFASDQIFENMEGRFTGHPIFGDVQYKYSVDSLKIEDIYKASGILGFKYALYFNDYFLNRHLLKNLPSGYDLMEYYHWDPDREKIFPIDEKYRFIEMDVR